MTSANDPGTVRNIERFEASGPVILLIGTLDTKADELGAVAEHIEALGGSVMLLDTSGRAHGNFEVSGPESGRILISRDDVATAAGTTGDAVAALPRGEAVAALRAGVAKHTLDLYESQRIDGALCVGGAGAYIARDAFASLPIGFPKMIVSPLASGNRTFEAYVGTRDVATLHSVADLVGVNSVTDSIYRTAASYIVGAAGAPRSSSLESSRPNVAISMNGNTTDALMRIRHELERSGRAVVAFHANGVGGRALEEFVASGAASAVLDYTTTELAGHAIGGLMDAGATRMETAGAAGIPQVLVPGCLDFITCGPAEAAERDFPNRAYFMHNPELTLVRLTTEEMARLGSLFARKANAARGPVIVCVPLSGLSVQDAPGKAFWDPAADSAFVQSLKRDLRSHVALHLLPHHINDVEFVEFVLEQLMSILPAVETAHDAGRTGQNYVGIG